MYIYAHTHNHICIYIYTKVALIPRDCKGSSWREEIRGNFKVIWFVTDVYDKQSGEEIPQVVLELFVLSLESVGRAESFSQAAGTTRSAFFSSASRKMAPKFAESWQPDQESLPDSVRGGLYVPPAPIVHVGPAVLGERFHNVDDLWNAAGKKGLCCAEKSWRETEKERERERERERESVSLCCVTWTQLALPDKEVSIKF